MVNYKIPEMCLQLDSEDLRLVNRIKKLRHSGNFQTIRKEIGDEKLTDLIRKLYPQNDFKSLEVILGVPDSSLGHWFVQLGIQRTRRRVSNFVFPASFDRQTVIAGGKMAKNISAIKLDENLAYLVGFCLGDGAVQKFMVEVFNKDKGMKEFLKATMKRYGKVQDVTRKDGLWKLRLSSVKIASLIKQNKKMVQETIEYIISDTALAQSFLAGLWDAEGSVLKQRNYFHVYLYNSNKELLDVISDYLNRYGIKNSTINVKQRTEPYNYKGRLIISRKPVYRLGVPKSYVKKWAELIGLNLKHSKKSAVVYDIINGDGVNE